VASAVKKAAAVLGGFTGVLLAYEMPYGPCDNSISIEVATASACALTYTITLG
jgi:hypothetical protein